MNARPGSDFLVECYRPGVGDQALVDEALRLTRSWTPEVRCVECVAMPEDAALLLVVRGPSQQAITTASDLIGLAWDRISSVLVTTEGPRPSPAET